MGLVTWYRYIAQGLLVELTLLTIGQARSKQIEVERTAIIEAIESKHVTMGINDFLAGRAQTHQARGKRTHL